ncbi:hypothetical protein AGLY_012526 [Aphis glycines]|uniref:Uncharacterized protein n=1 Tax=Aphis glycines TaxID=307491 RepID=A0A6G0T8L4_APHGL|nr:hypothetical protein AGLY_012526 [Aphis glycines]
MIEISELAIAIPTRGTTVIAANGSVLFNSPFQQSHQVLLIFNHFFQKTPLERITGSKLPSNGDILRRLLFLIRNEKKTVKESSTVITQELLYFWKCARIPTMNDYNITPKIEKEYMNWRALQKGKSRRSQPQIKKEEVFKDRLTDLFDIAHLNALQIIKIDEDKKFLLAQREKGRKGCMIGIDRKLEKQEMRKNQREIAFQNYKNRSKKTQELSVPDTVDLFSSESYSEEDIEFKLETTNNPNKRKRGRQNIMNSEIVTALDRTKVSDRNAVHILIATAQSLGCNANNIAINRSIIRRNRVFLRQKVSDDIKVSFKPDCPLTVHWDGKILPDITGKDNVDRLPILVSGDGVSKLLSVPKLESGTGEAISNAVIASLFDWSITDRVQSLSFDTTASNTGHINGACKLIKEKIGRKLLYLACRHHILEIVLGAIFTFDPEEWENMPDYQLGLSVVRCMQVVNDFAERGVALIQNYNSILTKDENQKQFLLQVVESHRKRFPDARKTAMTALTALLTNVSSLMHSDRIEVQLFLEVVYSPLNDIPVLVRNVIPETLHQHFKVLTSQLGLSKLTANKLHPHLA